MRGGILGRQLEMIIEDNGSEPATAVPASKGLGKRIGAATGALVKVSVIDPNATVSFLQSSRSAEPHLSEIECSEAAPRDLLQPAIKRRSASHRE